MRVVVRAAGLGPPDDQLHAQLRATPERAVWGFGDASGLRVIDTPRRSLDVVGHHARSDIFNLHVNTNALKPVEFDKS